MRRPAGEVHAWEQGTDQTRCGLALRRSGLERHPHVPWADVQPESGRHADEVQRVCPRCAASAGGRRQGERRWSRRDPRP